MSTVRHAGHGVYGKVAYSAVGGGVAQEPGEPGRAQLHAHAAELRQGRVLRHEGRYQPVAAGPNRAAAALQVQTTRAHAIPVNTVPCLADWLGRGGWVASQRVLAPRAGVGC